MYNLELMSVVEYYSLEVEDKNYSVEVHKEETTSTINITCFNEDGEVVENIDGDIKLALEELATNYYKPYIIGG